MVMRRLQNARRTLEAFFPERHIYVRSGGGQVRGLVLTTGRQIAIASGVAAFTLWLGVCTAAMMVSALGQSAAEQEVARTQAKYERWMADSQARLTSAVAQINAANGTMGDLADTLEKRQTALEALLTGPGAKTAASTIQTAGADQTVLERVEAVQLDQERLVVTAASLAKSRAERLRLAFKLAGLSPDAYIGRGETSLGGPLIEAKDPRALAAILDVDEDFAQRIQRAARDMSAVRDLTEAAKNTPFGRPTQASAETSSYGVRRDPFTGLPAFHSGLDFPGAIGSPVYATAPGVVSFTGQRAGYGNTVEIDHGHGLKTRYAHLAGIAVSVGQRVAVSQRVGAMGSTGRSTGPHLHYEVWVGGRAQNPERFLKAGRYVQQAG